MKEKEGNLKLSIWPTEGQGGSSWHCASSCNTCLLVTRTYEGKISYFHTPLMNDVSGFSVGRRRRRLFLNDERRDASAAWAPPG